jgi:hypothetical protein
MSQNVKAQFIIVLNVKETIANLDLENVKKDLLKVRFQKNVKSKIYSCDIIK